MVSIRNRPNRMVYPDRSRFVVSVFVLQDDFVNLKLPEKIEFRSRFRHVPEQINVYNNYYTLRRSAFLWFLILSPLRTFVWLVLFPVPRWRPLGRNTCLGPVCRLTSCWSASSRTPTVPCRPCRVRWAISSRYSRAECLSSNTWIERRRWKKKKKTETG